YLLILYKTQEIGRIYLGRNETSICLIDIAFLPEFRNRGFGTQILKNLINEAQSTQKKITIHVENFNPAYNWYVKHGFQHIEDKGVYQYMEWYPKSR
ncbi:MAG: GNAT family N-acetyltransferase, partial [Xanthomonadales bacterium]|nr:GNAT family N-acetyltransferase [Xanthomonadales bacterium]